MTTTYIDALGDQLTDADKLRILADWHDVQDDKKEFSGEREVQRDLRRIADALEAQQAVVVAARAGLKAIAQYHIQIGAEIGAAITLQSMAEDALARLGVRKVLEGVKK